MLEQMINMEENEFKQFNLNDFVTTRKKSFEKLQHKLYLASLSENIDSFNKTYDDLTKEIPELYSKEDLERNTSRMKDICRELLRNFLKFICALIKDKNFGLLFHEDVTLSYLRKEYDLSLATEITYHISSSPNFVLATPEDKIEKRVLIVVQNGQEEINSELEKATINHHYLYVLLLTIDTELTNIVANSTEKLTSIPETNIVQSQSRKQDSSELQKSVSDKILKKEKRSLRFSIPTASDSFDDVLNCIFSWITEAELLKEKDADSWTKDGEMKMSSRKFEESISSFDKALEFDPNYVQAIYSKGRALFEVKKYEDAITYLDKALEVDLNNSQRWYSKGEALAKLGQYGEAVAAYDKALEIDPNNVFVYYSKGLVLSNLGKYQEAIIFYDRALMIYSSYPQIYKNKGEALAKLGQYGEAVAAYDKALEKNAEDPQIWNNKGEALAKLGHYEEAVAAYDKAITIDRYFGNAWKNRGSALDNLERYKEANTSYEKGLEIDPDDYNTLNSKGSVMLELGRYKEAIQAFDKALDLNQNSDNSLKQRNIIQKFFELKPTEIVKLLKKGQIEDFNRLRQIGSFTLNLNRTDLKGANLERGELNDANFESAILSGSKLDFANLSNTNLSNADLSDTSLVSTNFSNANLSNANLGRSIIVETKFSNANLSNANLSNANSKFTGRSIYQRYDLIFHADLSSANLSRVDLRNAKIAKTYIIGTKLIEGLKIDAETDLSEAIIDNASLVQYIEQFTKNISNIIENKKDLVDRLKKYDEKTINLYLQKSLFSDPEIRKK